MGFNKEAVKSGGDKSAVTPGSQRALILEKIHALIDRADPDSWRHGGDRLRPDTHLLKPQKTWEEVFTQDIEKGTLVFRCSIAVTCEFLGRGFKPVPVSDPQYTVELRARGWHHSELTDPNRRSQLSDRTCHILAEGDIAVELFQHVEETFASFHCARQAEFDKQANVLASLLPSRLEEETVNSWDRNEVSPDEVHYTSLIDDCTVDVHRTIVDGREVYGITVSQRNLTSEIADLELVREVFTAVEELGQTSRLMTLSKALELL